MAAAIPASLRPHGHWRSPRYLLLLAALSMPPAVFAEASECRIPGMKIHWIADYCMSQLETDDEIAAGACIGDELNRAFTTDCAAKLHYKKAMCERAILHNYRQDGIANCLADTGFFGSTVRQGGVGGG